VANSSSGGNCFNNPLGPVSAGYNLSDDATCTSFTQTGDLNNTPAGLDPGGLQSNGGPTQTIALLATSPAVDAIPVSPINHCTDVVGNPVTTDQRGVSRPQGPACDIGAFELEQVRAAYVANAGSNSVSVIDPKTNLVVATIPVGPNPVDIAVTPNGSTAYVTNAGSNSVSVINTTSNTVVATVTVGFNPVNVAIKPDGTRAYVANARANSVSVIDTSTNAVVATVPVGLNPVDVAVTPNGSTAYVTNARSNSVSVINTTSNAVVATVTVGTNPVDVVIH
jgi:YVTN family beta-propeller protein